MPAPRRSGQHSAGVLAYRRRGRALQVLLVHPGGPFWANKDRGAWSIPKGELAPGEAPEVRARQEFLEETSFAVEGPLVALGDVRQKAGKVVTAFAVPAEIDAAACRSNTVTITWPPRSGKRLTIPEVDRAAWFDLAEARERINPAQAALLDRLAEHLKS